MDLIIARIDDAAVIKLLQNYITRHQKEFNNIVKQEITQPIEEVLTDFFEKKHTFKKGASLGATLQVSRKGKRGYTITEIGTKSGMS
jgi:hypothetical protein